MDQIELFITALGFILVLLLVLTAFLSLRYQYYKKKDECEWEYEKMRIIARCAEIERYCTPEFPDVVDCAAHIRKSIMYGDDVTDLSGITTDEFRASLYRRRDDISDFDK